MAIACALLVSDDEETIEEFKDPLRQLSISSDVCRDGLAAVNLLKRRKFDAVIVDFQLGQESGAILEELRLSTSNRTTRDAWNQWRRSIIYCRRTEEGGFCHRKTSFAAVSSWRT
jgi:CheY-like chemotaxis protein